MLAFGSSVIKNSIRLRACSQKHSKAIMRRGSFSFDETSRVECLAQSLPGRRRDRPAWPVVAMRAKQT